MTKPDVFDAKMALGLHDAVEFAKHPLLQFELLGDGLDDDVAVRAGRRASS